MEYGSTNYFVQRNKQDINEMQKISKFHGTHKICWAWPFEINNLFHGTVHNPPNFRLIVEILKELEQWCFPSSLSWKISQFRWMHKNRLTMVIIKNDLHHGTLYHPTNLQADTFRVVMPSFRMDRQTVG